MKPLKQFGILSYTPARNICIFSQKNTLRKERVMSGWMDGCIEKLKTEQVDVLLKEIEALEDRNKYLQKAKSELLTYLKNNRKRINYGKFIKEGLLIGSGAIESANRDVIQKRMKLSGQRWTVEGAKQMLNLRTCYKSNTHHLIKRLITENKNVA